MDSILLIITSLLLVFIAILFILNACFKPRKFQIQNSHVFITGGSSGIGKAIATEAVRKGAFVTIVARNQKKLEDAKDEIQLGLTDTSNQKVQIISVDITKNAEDVYKAVQKAEESFGPVGMLINCAGSAICKTFEDTAPEEFKRMMDLNYLGSVYTTKAVIPSMKSRKCGRVVFVSSQAGQIGLFGYTAYAASKYALRGFAESLQMEIQPYNIQLTLSHPADTDTPGYAEENITKPKETLLISETAGLFTPENVAKGILNDSVNGKFCSSIGLDGFLLANVTSGMSPVMSVLDAAIQIISMSVLRFICLFFLMHFNGIVKRCKQEREQVEVKKES